MTGQGMPYITFLIVTAIISVASALYTWWRRPVPGNGAIVLTTLAGAEWMIAYALELVSVNVPAKIFWNQVQYVGVVIVPATWLVFTLQYTGRENWVNRRTLLLLSIEPIATLLLVFTNEIHGLTHELIWGAATLESECPFTILIRPHGTGFWIHAAYTYTLLLTAAILLIQMLIRSRHLYRRQAQMLLLATSLPLLGNALMMLDLNPLPCLDLTPLAFTASSLTLTWSLFNLRVGDIRPVACDRVVASMTDGIIVLDEQNRVVGLNAAAQHIVGRTASEAIGHPVERVWPAWPGPVEQFHNETAIRMEVVVGKKDEQHFYDVRISPIVDWRGCLTSQIIVLCDVTERKQAEEALQGRTERLRIIHEIDSAILAAQSLEEIAQAALRHIQQLAPCQYASVAVFDFETLQATVIAAHAASDIGIEAGACISLNGTEKSLETLWQSQIHLEKDIWGSPHPSPAIQTMQASGLRSCIIAPLISQEELIGSLSLWSDQPGAFTPEHVQIASELADSLTIAIQHTRLFESVKQQREKLRALTARLTEAEVNERRRLARELHDEVGKNLTVLGINLNLIRAQIPEKTANVAHSRINDSLTLVEETTARIRDVMADLRPPILDDYGLIATLHWYGERFTSRTGVAVTVQGEEPDPRLAAQAENTLFRIAQEALNNVAKHAQATQVIMTVTTDDKTVRLVIADDGVGFDPAQPIISDESQGWGLLTMTERAEAVGGCFQIESRPQQGTQVIVETKR